MASRNVFALLLVAICAVGAVAASEAEGRRALRMFPGFPQPQQPQPGFPGFPQQQPQQPGFPQQVPQQPGFPQQLPQQPGFPQNHQQIPHQVFPQFQEQPTPLDFHSHSKGCARNHVIKMSMYGLACLPDTRTSSHHSYPARDDLSKKLCPYNFLYRLVDNVHPACLPESYVYDGVWEVQVHGD